MAPEVGTDHPACNNVLKARADLTAMKWLVGILITVILAAGVGFSAGLTSTRTMCNEVTQRIGIAEERHKRTQDDFHEIKSLLRDMDSKIDSIREDGRSRQ